MHIYVYQSLCTVAYVKSILAAWYMPTNVYIAYLIVRLWDGFLLKKKWKTDWGNHPVSPLFTPSFAGPDLTKLDFECFRIAQRQNRCLWFFDLCTTTVGLFCWESFAVVNTGLRIVPLLRPMIWLVCNQKRQCKPSLEWTNPGFGRGFLSDMKISFGVEFWCGTLNLMLKTSCHFLFLSFFFRQLVLGCQNLQYTFGIDRWWNQVWLQLVWWPHDVRRSIFLSQLNLQKSPFLRLVACVKSIS